MHVEVAFQDERLTLEIPDDRVIGVWNGPESLPKGEIRQAVLTALNAPVDYPPLRQALVPGDQVTIPFDASIPDGKAVLEAVYDVLRDAGVESSAIHLLMGPTPASGELRELPGASPVSRHDPDDRSSHAYLAATSKGRRVYLNRLITDADFVLPIGRLGYDPALGYCGSWSVLYPGMSNAETTQAFAAIATDDPADRNHDRPALTESTEVSWLLGTQFQIGIVDGVDGPAAILAGRDSQVLAQGKQAVDSAWSFRVDRSADLVVAGIGGPGQTTGASELAQGLATAMRLVRRGGKIVALSRATGALGPAVQRLMSLEDPGVGVAALKGAEAEPDYVAARQLARALAWADVYLLSGFDEQDVEALGIVALAKPPEAGRLAASAASVTFVSRAERTRAEVADEDA